jgi:hypothetical protein
VGIPGGWARGLIHYTWYEPGGLLQKKKLLFQINFIAIIFFIVASRYGDGQSEVVIHASAMGANRINSGSMRVRAWATHRARTVAECGRGWEGADTSRARTSTWCADERVWMAGAD